MPVYYYYYYSQHSIQCLRQLFTLTFEVCTMLRAVMTVRQRVSTVLRDEALIVERNEAQFRHFNGVEDVIGKLERVKFCHGIHFFSRFKTARKSQWWTFFLQRVSLRPLPFSVTSFHSPRSIFSPSTRRTLLMRDSRFRPELAQYSVIFGGIERMVFFEIAGVVFVQVHLHVLVQIWSLNVATEGVGVGEK